MIFDQQRIGFRAWLLLGCATCVLAAALTWPLASPGPVAVPASDDAYFSIWRLSWVAHQLIVDPRHLFDANVFHPAAGTLAYSDAMLFEGFLAAPLLYLGIEPARVHNILLLLGMVSSALAAFLLAWRLTNSLPASMVGGVIFGFAPFRFAHIGHLELQWLVWMPLGMLALHAFAARPSAWGGTLLGGFLALQVLSSIYNGVFLACYLLMAWTAFLWLSGEKRRFVTRSLAAIVPLLIVVAIYGPPYARTRAEYGARPGDEQRQYSAVAADFLRVPPENRLRGQRGTQVALVAPDERSLYPGAAAIGLSIVALWPPVSTTAVVYAGLAAFSFDAALGVNGLFFPTLQRVLPVVTSLRAPARFGGLVLLSLAILACVGLARIQQRWPKAATAAVVAAIAICLLEYWSAPVTVRPYDTSVSEAHRYLASQPPGSAVIELPLPTPDGLWLYETTYQVRSIHHWQPLVNGYSAFVPRDYVRTLEAMKTFPSTESIRRLQQLRVKFVLLNRSYYKDEEEFQRLAGRVMEFDAFWPPRAFGSGDNKIVIAELK